MYQDMNLGLLFLTQNLDLIYERNNSNIEGILESENWTQKDMVMQKVMNRA